MKDLTDKEWNWLNDIIKETRTSYLCEMDELVEYLAEAIIANREI